MEVYDAFDDCLMWTGKFWVGYGDKTSVEWPSDFGTIDELQRSYAACGQGKPMMWDGNSEAYGPNPGLISHNEL